MVKALRQQCAFPSQKSPPSQGGGSTHATTIAQTPLRKSKQKIKSNKTFEILYIGSSNGLEREIVSKWGWPYVSIPVGKFRRYFDLRNFLDPFKVVAGFLKSLWVVGTFRPDVIFSKGGYVSLPVMAAGWCLRVPIVLHDSDARPSLTTKLAARWVKTLCLGYAEAARHLSHSVQKKIVVTGVPIREEILKGDRKRGFAFTGLKPGKPVVLVMGGSLGAQRINEAVWNALPRLLKEFQVVHLTGKGKLAMAPTFHLKGYFAVEYVAEELPHLYAMADVVVSRAGASAIAEIETLRKPCVLIPIGSEVSHGDQLINAEILQARGRCEVIPDEELSMERLVKTIHRKLTQKLTPPSRSASMHQQRSAADEIARVLIKIC